jgi:excisionase family DNA binding protein
MSPLATISLDEVARLLAGEDLKCPERWVVRRIKEGKIPATRVGRTYRFTEEQVREAIQRLTTTATPECGAALPDGITADMLPTDLTPTSRRRRRRS